MGDDVRLAEYAMYSPRNKTTGTSKVHAEDHAEHGVNDDNDEDE